MILAIVSQRHIFTWGYIEYGQLGVGTNDYNSHSTPTEITIYSATLVHQENYDFGLETIEYYPVLEVYTFSG